MEGGERGGSTFTFRALLWEHESTSGWHFLSLPDDVADEIEAASSDRAGGFGSIRVEATIGATTWRTSLFPDARRRTYVLPIKRPVRAAEGLDAGSWTDVAVSVLV